MIRAYPSERTIRFYVTRKDGAELKRGVVFIKEIVPKPLLAWSILQARNAAEIDSVWVTSDDDEILAVAEAHGAHAIRRPPATRAWPG